MSLRRFVLTVNTTASHTNRPYGYFIRGRIIKSANEYKIHIWGKKALKSGGRTKGALITVTLQGNLFLYPMLEVSALIVSSSDYLSLPEKILHTSYFTTSARH